MKKSFWRDLLRGLAGLYLLLLMVGGLTSLFFSTPTSADEVLLPPSWQHWLGTDALGRDLLLRSLQGSVTSLLVGVFASLFSFMSGIAIGLWSGWKGGLSDSFFMRLVDVMDSLPDLLLACVIVFLVRESLSVSSLSGSVLGVSLGLGLSGWMSLARQTRVLTLREARQDYIQAARSLGAGPFRILRKHLFPNIRRPLLIFAMFQIPNFIVFEGALSFFGLGIQPPYSSWGLMLTEGWRALPVAPNVAIVPGALMVITLVAFFVLIDRQEDS